MAILSTNMNELSLNETDCSIKERLIYNDDELKQTFLASLNAQRKQNRQTCDVVLAVGAHEHKIFAHRAVLSLSIPCLEKMTREAKNELPSICLPDLEPFAVEALVEFVYSAKLELSPDRVWDVLSAADSLDIPEIVKLSQVYIQEHMLADCWLYARQIASERDFSSLVAAVDRYVVENFASISRSADFLQLPRLQVELMNKRSSSEETSENERPNEILGLVLDWCKERLEEEDLVEYLMENNHLLYATSEHTLKDCKNENVDSNNNVCVTDAQKEYIRQQSNERPASPSKSPRRVKNLPYKWSKDSSKKSLRFYKSELRESCKPEKEFRLLASTALSEGCYVGLAVITTELVCISVYCNEQIPSCNSFVSSEDEVSLSLIKPMIRGRCSVGVAELSGKVYAVGGYDRGHCLSLVECYDQEKNEWVLSTPLTSARGRLGLTCLNEKLYAIGGSNGNSELKSGECFDPETKQWSKVANMSICRSNFGVCSMDGKVFAVGGTNGLHSLESVEVFNPETSNWTNVAPMQVGRESVCVEVVDGRLYACGGYSIWQCLESVECYSPKDDCWSLVATLNTRRRGAGAAVHDGKLYIVGGSDGNNFLKSVECYDPSTNTWTYVASMNTPRHNVGVTVSNGYIFAVGGFDGVAFLNSTEFYDPDMDKWSAFTKV